MWKRAAPTLLLPIVLVVLGHATPLLGQETQTLPPAESVPRDSTMDVQTLPTPSPPAPTDQLPTKVKPFRTPDPEGLRQWKDLLDRHPGALPTAPEATEDRTPQNAPK